MRLTIDLFTALSCIISFVSSRETYLYEKQNFFGLGKRLIQKGILSRKVVLSRHIWDRLGSSKSPKPRPVYINLDSGVEHPQPLPTLPSPQFALSSRSLYQGTRNPTDTRVFRRRFDYEARSKGHQIHCEGMFSCTITFLAIESTEAIPVILRGGAGYKYFTAVVKAKPGRELKGQVRAYCKKEQTEEIYTGVRELRRFKLEQSTTGSDD